MHPYLRAYMAGVALPTMIVPVVILGIAALHPTGHEFDISDVVIFPVAFVPIVWGVWNVLHVWVRRYGDIPIGVFGALLPFVLAPLGYAVQLGLGKMLWTPALFALGFPVTLAVYYLAWKHIVARFNDVLGIG
jgi:hypothetical protein